LLSIFKGIINKKGKFAMSIFKGIINKKGKFAMSIFNVHKWNERNYYTLHIS